MLRRHDYQAEQTHREQVQSDPRRPDVHGRLAAWLTRAGRLAQAREALHAGLAQARPAPGLHRLLGLILAGAGDYEAAERHLVRTTQQEPARFEYLRDLAFAQGAAGKTGESVAALRRAIALAGEQADGLGWLLRLGERAVAERGVKRAGEVRQPRRPPRPRRRAAVVERIVTHEPEVAEALITPNREPTPEMRETLRAARRALARLAAEHPSYPDLYFRLSLVGEQMGEIDRAIEQAEKALALNPRYAEACLLAVRLYEKCGRPAEAAERCRRATEMRPQWLDAHLRLGRLLREQGRTGEAAAAYRRALAVDAACTDARQHLETLEAALAPQGGEG